MVDSLLVGSLSHFAVEIRYGSAQRLLSVCQMQGLAL